MFTTCWILVGMLLYVQNVVNGVIFAQFVEFQYPKLALERISAYIMSVLKLALFPKDVMRDFKK